MHAPVNALDDHDRVVDHESDRNRKAAHRHQVDRLVEDAHDREGCEHGERQRHRGDEREPPVAQECEQHNHGEHAADENGIADAADRCADEFGEVVDLGDMQAGGQRLGELAERLFDARFNLQQVRANLLRDGDARRFVRVALDDAGAIGRCGHDGRDVTQADDGLRANDDGRVADLIDRLPQPGSEGQLLHAARRLPSHRCELIGAAAAGRRRRAR